MNKKLNYINEKYNTQLNNDIFQQLMDNSLFRIEEAIKLGYYPELNNTKIDDNTIFNYLLSEIDEGFINLKHYA